MTTSFTQASNIFYTITMDPGYKIYLFGDGDRFIHGMCTPDTAGFKVHISVFNISRIERQPDGKLFIYSNNMKSVDRNRIYPTGEQALAPEEFKRLWDMYQDIPLEATADEFGIVADHEFDVLLF